MNLPESTGLEKLVFDRLGMTLNDAVATAVDLVDGKAADAVDSGIDVDAKLTGLSRLLNKLSEPATVAALNDLIDRLPQLTQLAKLSDELPNLAATAGNLLEEQQQRLGDNGIDLEKALINGVQAALWLGSNVDLDRIHRVGDLLGSEVLNPNAVSIVDTAAKSLTDAKANLCETQATPRIGLFGLLGALRNPEVQRSLAFAIQFGKCFGKNLDRK